MKVAIIQYDNNEYFIDQKNNDFEVTKLNNNELRTLSISEQYSLFKEIFDSKLEYKTNYNGYDIYIDEAGNKRFFKDGIEDYQLFFIDNGENALLCNEPSKDNDNSEIKKYKLLSKCKRIIIFANIALILGQYSTRLLKQVMIETGGEIVIADLSNYDLDVDSAINDLLSNNNIDMDKKEYLNNKDFIGDILSISDTKHKYVIEERLKSFNLEYFTDKEKERNIDGYYNLFLNKISLRDDSDNIFNSSFAHEFVHLMQHINKYSYLIEASATQLAHEYYNVPINSYLNEVSRIKILMEIIGPKPILECSFKGDTTSFENKIHEVLNEKAAEEFLELLTNGPAHDEKRDEHNKRVSEILKTMYKKIYNEEYDDKEMYGITEYHDKFYFNTHNEKINDSLVVGWKVDKNSEIDIDKADTYQCNISKTVVKEDKISDKEIYYYHECQKSTARFNNYEAFQEFYKSKKNEADKYCSYEYYVIPKNGEDGTNIQVYGDVDENGEVKFYTKEESIVIPSILEKFPDQFNNNTNKVEKLFDSSNDNENNIKHTR